MTNLVKYSQLTKTSYEITMFDSGNVVTIRLQVGLVNDFTMQEFIMPLRESSQKYVAKLSGFGIALLRSLSETGGVTRVNIKLYEVTVQCGGLFDTQVITREIEAKLKDLYEQEGFEAIGEIIVRTMPGEKKATKERIHPFGSLPLRLQAVRLRGKHIPNV